MKIARLFVLASLALTSCSGETESKDKHLVSKEIYGQKLGDVEVLGVRMRLTTPLRKETLGAKVSLLTDEKTFVDTIYLDLRQGDTVETEAVFTGALKANYKQTEATVEFFNL